LNLSITHDNALEGGGPILQPTKTQLPATIHQTGITADQRALNVVPALIADAGAEAGWRYVDFFTANIRNPRTRRAYARACARFFAWCEERGLPLTAVRPYDVATCIEVLQQEHSAPGVKQQLAAVQMLFDWMINGQVMHTKPAAAVHGRKKVKTGKTPVLEGAEWRKLLNSIPATTLRDLRDRALIATRTYSFARITAALKMKVVDLRPCGAGWTIRLHEKGGKQHAMPCHHALAAALRAYIHAAGIVEDRKGWLFRTARGHNGSSLSDKPMSQPDVWRMIRRRAAAAGIAARSVVTRSAPPGSPPTSPTAARSSTRRKWRRTRARARPSSTIAPRSGSPKTRWRGSGCEH
jgi:site-specific recombinase XerD